MALSISVDVKHNGISSSYHPDLDVKMKQVELDSELAALRKGCGKVP